MNVKDKFPIDASHSIEWGEATWDEDEVSIRNRFNTDSGKFNQAGSSELPWADFKLMIRESIRRNKFSNTELAEVLAETLAKLAQTK